MLPLVCTIVSVLALCVLLYGESRETAPVIYISKPLASLAFILVAVTGGALGDTRTPYSTWLVIGLVLGAGGDVALMLPGKRAFLIGLVLFLLGHIAYVVAFTRVVEIGAWPSVYSLAPAVAAVVVTRWLWPHLGNMRGPVLAYIAVITTMLVGAIAILLAEPPERIPLGDRTAALLFAGALAFYLSDLAVARQRFVTESVSNRLWGLPAYYGGQLLLAWTCFG